MNTRFYSKKEPIFGIVFVVTFIGNGLPRRLQRRGYRRISVANFKKKFGAQAPARLECMRDHFGGALVARWPNGKIVAGEATC